VTIRVRREDWFVAAGEDGYGESRIGISNRAKRTRGDALHRVIDCPKTPPTTPTDKADSWQRPATLSADPLWISIQAQPSIDWTLLRPEE